MKILNSLIIVLTSIMMSSCGTETSKSHYTDWQKEGLKGKVKLIEKAISYYHHGKQAGPSFTSHTQYNTNGFITDIHSSNSSLVPHQKPILDGNHIIGYTSYNDKNGIIQKNIIVLSNKVEENCISKDKDDQHISAASTQYLKGQPYRSTTYFVQPPDTVINHFHYNKKGDLQQLITQGLNSSKKNVIYINYSDFDALGNWTESTSYSDSLKQNKLYTATRKITYFN